MRVLESVVYKIWRSNWRMATGRPVRKLLKRSRCEVIAWLRVKRIQFNIYLR